MSKLKIRIALSILLGLAVVLAIATTVQGAPVERTESHSASESLATYDGLIVTEREAYLSELDAYNNSTKRDGHDCGSYDGPID